MLEMFSFIHLIGDVLEQAHRYFPRLSVKTVFIFHNFIDRQVSEYESNHFILIALLVALIQQHVTTK